MRILRVNVGIQHSGTPILAKVTAMLAVADNSLMLTPNAKGETVTPKNEVEHGVCSYCGADRSGPSAEAHEPNCLYAEPEPQGSDNSAGPGVPLGYVQVAENEPSLSCHVCGAILTPTKWKCKSCGATTEPTQPQPSAELKDRAREWRENNIGPKCIWNHVPIYEQWGNEVLESILAAFASSIHEEAAYHEKRADDAEHDLEASEQQLAEARAQAWISVEERSPLVNMPVLLFWGESQTIEMGWRCFDGDKEIFQLERTDPQDEPITRPIRDGCFTHWQELPKPPAEPRAGRDLEDK